MSAALPVGLRSGIRSWLALAVLLLPALASPANSLADVIAIKASPIDNFHIGSNSAEVGRLVFVGGLELASDDARFGGLSGLRISPDGSRLYAVSDDANWFVAKVMRSTNQRLKDLANVRVGCLCRTDGRPYGSKHWGDSEGLEIRGDTGYVAYERLNRINRYAIGPDGLPGKPVQATASFKPYNIAYNEGLEAMALGPDGGPLGGWIVAIAEQSPDSDGNNRAFLARKDEIREFAIVRSDEYSVTDAAFLPGGDLVILERRFGLSVGLGMRIRRFKAAGITAGAVLEGEVLAEAGLASRIDNMEGISAWKTAAGETVITLVSDDNFNKRLQRTLLLEFVLEE